MNELDLFLMRYFRDTYLADMKGCTVLDVGSRQCSRQPTFRELFAEYQYTGMDLLPGPNIDIVGYENLGVYDVLISGNVMEHVKHPWDWLKSLVPYFTHYICIIVPNTHREHREPYDTYRYFPDGMVDLFEYAGIEVVEARRDKHETIGIGRK